VGPDEREAGVDLMVEPFGENIRGTVDALPAARGVAGGAVRTQRAVVGVLVAVLARLGGDADELLAAVRCGVATRAGDLYMEAYEWKLCACVRESWS
jgi:hypothetical protein